MIIHNEELYNKFHVFKDRIDAGDKLTDFILNFKEISAGSEIVAIPAGGVPVASKMAEKLELKLKVLLVSKILFPWTSEAGFGALSMFGDFEINKQAIQYYGIDDETIEEQLRKTRTKIENRMKIIPKECFIEKGNETFIVDDGLASGYTMLVALKSARRFYNRVYVAIPTASSHAINLLSSKCDEIFCLNLRGKYPYAVADAYIEWHDVGDEEMIEFLRC
ncbi:phosphoribosyltransferase [Archaeoglobales archaeon]|mgnify:CR=1 FL=1|nr:MAG: phosphoribosyltransferase [Archaeoglobales archaeon]